MAYVTIEEAQRYVGTTEDMRQIHLDMAQGVIEIYTGRPEARVTDPDDLFLLKQATAYQAAYMVTNTEVVFQEPAMERITQDTFTYVPGNEDAPHIAPMARIACQRLSWMSSRSITTAPQKRRERILSWWYE